MKKHARIGVTNCRGSKSIDLEAGEGSDSGTYVYVSVVQDNSIENIVPDFIEIFLLTIPLHFA